MAYSTMSNQLQYHGEYSLVQPRVSILHKSRSMPESSGSVNHEWCQVDIRGVGQPNYWPSGVVWSLD